MVSYDIPFRIEKMSSDLAELKQLVNKLHASLCYQEALWDNSDMIRYFKVSDRTLAYWRSSSLISYRKINGKIYYTKVDREAFLEQHKVNLNDCNLNKGRRILS